MTSIRAKLYIAMLRKISRDLDAKEGASIDTNRKNMEKNVRAIAPIKSRLKQFEPVNAAGVSALWVGKKTSPHILLYLHGGGYAVGSARTHALMCDTLCTYANLRGLVLDYRLAPEHKFPAGLDDAEAAYDWLRLTHPAARIFVAGDSAGGGLSLALTLRLKTHKKQLPDALGLISPWTDLTASGESVKTRAIRDPMIAPHHLTEYAAYYADDDLKNPLVSPVFGDMHDMPPMLVQVGSEEILFDDSTRVVDAVKAAKGDARLQIWDKMPHVHQIALFIPEAKRALQDMASFFTSHI